MIAAVWIRSLPDRLQLISPQSPLKTCCVLSLSINTHFPSSGLAGIVLADGTLRSQWECILQWGDVEYCFMLRSLVLTLVTRQETLDVSWYLHCSDIYSDSHDFCDVSDDTGDEGTEDSQLSLTLQFTSALLHVLSSFRSLFLFNIFCFRDQPANTAEHLSAEEPDREWVRMRMINGPVFIYWAWTPLLMNAVSAGCVSRQLFTTK